MSHEVKAENKRSFRHDRKCGEWLRANVKQGQRGDLSKDVTSLKDLNVTKNESSRLQKIAAIPDKIVNITNLQDATKNKISLSENLQDAYKQIESIEAQAI